MIINDKLNRTKQLDVIVAKLSVAIRALHRLKKYIPKKSLIEVNYSIAYSHLQYGIINWGNYLQYF